MTHGVPFSDTVRALTKKIFESSNSDEKHQLMLELADSYSEDADWTDLSLPEELHKYAEESMKLKADSYAASMRLGRLLVRLVSAFEAHRRSESPEFKSPSFAASAKPDVGPN